MTGEQEQMVLNSIGIVYKVVRRYKKRAKLNGIEEDDLAQIGVIGLMRAVEKFDESLGYKFSSYAYPMICNEIKRYLRDHGSDIKFNRKTVYLNWRIYSQFVGNEPIEEIAKALGESIENVISALNYSMQPLRLDKMFENEDGESVYLSNFSGRKDDESQYVVAHFLSTIPKRYRYEVIQIMNERPQWEISHHIGVAQNQISRDKRKIEKWLREYLNDEVMS